MHTGSIDEWVGHSIVFERISSSKESSGFHSTFFFSICFLFLYFFLIVEWYCSPFYIYFFQTFLIMSKGMKRRRIESVSGTDIAFLAAAYRCETMDIWSIKFPRELFSSLYYLTRYPIQEKYVIIKKVI